MLVLGGNDIEVAWSPGCGIFAQGTLVAPSLSLCSSAEVLLCPLVTREFMDGLK